MSALHISAKDGRVDVINALIAECPDTCELLDNRDRTALHVAAESGQVNVVNFLVQTPAFEDLINEQDEDGNTAFHLAALNGHYELLMMLADDSRIAWMALNEDGMSTVDIIQSDKQLMSEEKILFHASKYLKLQYTTCLTGMKDLLSLERAVHRKTTTVQTLDTPAAKNRSGIIGSEDNASDIISVDEKKMSDYNAVAMSIITTVTFAAAVQLPGGYEGGTGKSLLRQNHYFKGFLLCDSFAFSFSALSMIIHFLSFVFPNVRGPERL